MPSLLVQKWHSLFSLLRVDADLLLVSALALEFHDAVLQGKQRIVASFAHIHSGINLRASLANQDVASQHSLAIASL